jgi:hypothetical protein
VDARWRYAEVEGSHWIPLDAPEPLDRLVLEWIDLPRAR